jgi:ribosome recycling factor
MTAQELIKDAEHRMKNAVEVTAHDFQKIRTGRASAVMLEDILVDYYGVPTPITQLGNITVPEPRQLLIEPWEKNLLGAIEKAIQKSDLGINPGNDGQKIRLGFPQMSEERRKEMVKQVHNRAEEGCVAIRNVRRDANDHLKKLQKNKEISEDDLKSMEKRIQDFTDKHIADVHEIQKKKEQELLEI